MHGKIGHQRGVPSVPRGHLSFRQILEAAQQLPVTQRENLVEALTQRPSPEDVLKAAQRLRPAFRLSSKKRKRMSYLTAKRSEGTLTAGEVSELNELVEETTESSLRMAEAITKAVEVFARARLGHNGMSKR
jgi:pantoate kinase